ncbi:prepilin-type N-terminal cleavage/methylation domain-containing protein [Luteimonas sp. SJ-92]|uniref:Prepilin-type N-terminal cleavage/methylation domain-containing protein n=1 Tax=Luteimonas salinisoli TaxID=2752307 RepID=A0A853JCY9_9GAMM|nr:prepilin-type N-terminal cleavage/methylation domain-containing protein [Luteimonas salinisoli]NZA26448.1 prepilin-type N-terminal cleavage/methylation domain-containing protein [Luteimonas salinisoli]
MSRSRNIHRRGVRTRRQAEGFTLLELVFAVAIAAVISMLAMSQFSDYAERSRVATAKADISVISIDIQRYRNDHGKLPGSLADVGRGGYLDPWKNPYHYADVTGPGGKGKARKDKKFNPLNSDFDLFSAGKDGVFHNQVSHKDSLDDVIRARDGSFIDVAEKF